MGIPVVIATNGLGIPVKQVTSGAPEMTVATNGLGMPIVLSNTGMPFVVNGGDPLTPVNTVAPAITGTVGTIPSTLNGSTGTWTNTPDSYNREYYRNGVDTGVSGANYTSANADNGMFLREKVTAVKAGHPSGVAWSAPVLIGTALTISGMPGAATQGSAYSFTPTASGGNGTNSFALTGPALPAGLSFSTSTGAITGTPTVVATTSGYSITVTNLAGSATLGPFSLEVDVPSVTPTLEIVVIAIEADSTEVGVVARDVGDTNPANAYNWRTRATSGIATSLPYDEAVAPDGTSYLAWSEGYVKQNITNSGLPTYVIPHAWNGTHIVDITAGDSTWGVGRSLHESSISRANTAIAAILAANPGAVPRFTILVSGGTNDAGLDAPTWEANIEAAVSDFRSRVFVNGVSGTTIGTSAPVIFRGMSPEFLAANSGGNPIEYRIRKMQYAITNARYWKQPEGQGAGDNVHPGLVGQRNDGIGAANTRDDTTAPVITFPSSFSIYTGQKLGREIVTDKPAWYYLTGADAAQFEIVPLTEASSGVGLGRTHWYLRWASDGNAPAAGTYNVTISAKGSAPSASTQAVVVTVAADYGSITETIVPTWTIGSNAVTDNLGHWQTTTPMPLKRGVNEVICMSISGSVTWTGAVASNGLVGVADANNSGDCATFYIYSAQDETVDYINLSYTGSPGDVFVHVVNVVGTTKTPASSAMTTSAATVSMTCPASGIVLVGGFDTGDITPPSGQTDFSNPPHQPYGITYAGYRTTSGNAGGTSHTFGKVFATAWNKA